MTPLPLLTVSDFTSSRGGRVLFDQLSFQVCSGEVHVLMGPNGAGKTTLLRSLAGIPQSVPAILKQPSLTHSYVGHLNALKANLTVRQNLTQQTKLSPDQLQEAFNTRGLTSIADREIRTLSAGQKRQIALTRLSLSGAKLWLADEPTTHLDDKAAAQFWASLVSHLKEGGAAVLTSHAPIPLCNAKVIVLHG